MTPATPPPRTVAPTAIRIDLPTTHPDRLFMYEIDAGADGLVRCAHCRQLWPCPVAIAVHQCMDSGVCDPGHRCAFLAEWEGNLSGVNPEARRRAAIEARNALPVDGVRPDRPTSTGAGGTPPPAGRLTPAYRDVSGRLVVDPRVRDILADTLNTVWPGQYGTVDEFLARRLPCGTVPAAVSIVVQVAYGAVEAADQRAAT